MPPSPLAPLDTDDLELVREWIDAGAVCDGDDDPVTPVPDGVGPTARYRRLTHLQWENTVADLFELPVAGRSDGFLGDTLSPSGFDNDGERLQIGPELWSDHQRAAEALARDIVWDASVYARVVPEDPAADVLLDPSVRFGPDVFGTTAGELRDDGWSLSANGEVYVDHVLAAGSWRLTARVWGDQAGPDPVRLALEVDDVELLAADVLGSSVGEAELHDAVFQASGAHRLSVAFTNDFVDDSGADRNLVVQWIEVTPVVEAPYDPVVHRPLARAFIERFGGRAFRRPLTLSEVDRYLALFDAGVGLPYTGLPFRDGIYTVLLGMLQSPHLLYQVEPETEVDGSGEVPLSAWTLASKLSYGLTNTMPDDVLFAAAADGSLTDPTVLRAQADRLLAGGRAPEAIDHFHHQLLHLDSYANIHKDRSVFPSWSPALREPMAEEARRTAREAVFSGASVFGLLTSPHTYVGPELAPLYGVEVTANEPVRVELDPSQRAGLLTQVGFLAANAHATSVDSIHRGVFVNLRVLCNELPPAPDVVAPLPPAEPGLTNRERVDRHTGAGTCGQGCHSTVINPVGFAFENYDALGRWQAFDAGRPIDASGSFRFADGPEFWSDPVGFAAVVGQSDDAHRCLIGNWLRYVHGRDLNAHDTRLLDTLTSRSRTEDRPLRELVLDLVVDRSFRYRAAELP